MCGAKAEHCVDTARLNQLSVDILFVVKSHLHLCSVLLRSVHVSLDVCSSLCGWIDSMQLKSLLFEFAVVLSSSSWIFIFNFFVLVLFKSACVPMGSQFVQNVDTFG